MCVRESERAHMCFSVLVGLTVATNIAVFKKKRGRDHSCEALPSFLSSINYLRTHRSPPGQYQAGLSLKNCVFGDSIIIQNIVAYHHVPVTIMRNHLEFNSLYI